MDSESPIAHDDSIYHKQLLRHLLDFLETAFHAILYMRNVYPASIFLRRQRWEIPVWQSSHPELNRYVKDALSSIQADFQKGNVQKVILVLKNDDDRASERWIFGIHEEENKQLELYDNMEDQLGGYFRGLMRKINVAESSLRPLRLDDSATFSIVVEMRDNTNANVDKSFVLTQWAPTEGEMTISDPGEDSEIQMLHILDLGSITLTLAVQQFEDDDSVLAEGGLNAEKNQKSRESLHESMYYYNY